MQQQGTYETSYKNDIEKWCKDRNEEAATKIFWSVVDAVGAVAATVATGGAAAGSLIAAGMSLVSVGASIANVVKALKEIYKAMKEFDEELEPMIEKLTKLYEAVNTLVVMLNDENSIKEFLELQRIDVNLDVINASALWDYFIEYGGVSSKVRFWQ